MGDTHSFCLQLKKMSQLWNSSSDCLLPSPQETGINLISSSSHSAVNPWAHSIGMCYKEALEGIN